MHNRFRAPFLVALGLALIAYAAYEAGRRGLADAISIRSRYEVNLWSEKQAAPSFEQWQRAVESLRSAMKLSPEDPSLYDHLGVAYEVASTTFNPGAGWSVYHEFSLAHFRQATVLRPTSPYSWANVALEKYLLGQWDDEMYRALAAAMRLGPWEPGVQLITSDLSLLLWEHLPRALKAEALENWDRTAERQAEPLARLAVASNRIDMLCTISNKSLRNSLKCASG
jgi:tetratricopeptide (TPR) repeat protein